MLWVKCSYLPLKRAIGTHSYHRAIGTNNYHRAWLKGLVGQTRAHWRHALNHSILLYTMIS
jgi:hypothetical protein